MPLIASYPKTWSAEVLTYADLNTQFEHIRTGVNASCLFVDVASQTVSVAVTFSAVQTFSAIPVFSAGINVANALTFSAAAGQIVPGATSLALRNNANNADNLIILDAGGSTFRGAVTAAGLLTTTLSASGATTFNTVAYTWPGSGSTGFLKNTAGTLSWVAGPDGSGTAGKMTKWTDSDTIQAATTAENSSGFVTNATQPNCRVYKSANQTVTAGSVISFDTELFDTGAMHAAGGNDSRITIPTSGDGVYLIGAQIYPQTTWGAQPAFSLGKNGSASGFNATQAANGSLTPIVLISLVTAVAADYFTLINSSASSLSVAGGTGSGDTTHFWAVKLW